MSETKRPVPTILRKRPASHARLWRELVWLVAGWHDREPPDRWNSIFVRELRRGSWRNGLVPRVMLLQVFCLVAWFLADRSGSSGFWTLMPAVCSFATLLLEARSAAADHRSESWELFRVTGHSHRLWWQGWKQLHFINLLSALSTLLPWAIVVNVTRTSHFGVFFCSALLCIPASCLSLRRWTAFGLATTPWKRRGLMLVALLWLEPMMAGGWVSFVYVLESGLGSGGLIFCLAVLGPPVLLSFYSAFWLNIRVRQEFGETYPQDREGFLLFFGCVGSLLSVFNLPTILFFVVMAVNLSNRRQAKAQGLPLPRSGNDRHSALDETMRTFRV